MRVLIIGSGGREHALGHSIAKSLLLEKIYFAPGNGGTCELGENIPIAVDAMDALLGFALSHDVDLTVVGPEYPLSLGIADVFRARGLKVFGPGKKGALLESSKAFAKDFMVRHDIPTARYATFDCLNDAQKALPSFACPLVLKADGLAAGKGVLICNTFDEAERGLLDLMQNEKFGAAGDKVVIEEFLQGKEASILCFVDGKSIVPMVSAQDYKRAHDGDEGLNTGGMGAISGAPSYTPAVEAMTNERIIQRTLKGLQKEGIDFKGVLYFGVMITEKGPFLLEYNARFGDPETEAVLMRLDSDLLEIMLSVCDERLNDQEICWSDDYSQCVVLVSGGYPETFEKGFEIQPLPKTTDDVAVFHSGTLRKGQKLCTDGGRVLVVSARGSDPASVRKKVYETIDKIKFTHMEYRSDIGGDFN